MLLSCHRALIFRLRQIGQSREWQTWLVDDAEWVASQHDLGALVPTRSYYLLRPMAGERFSVQARPGIASQDYIR